MSYVMLKEPKEGYWVCSLLDADYNDDVFFKTRDEAIEYGEECVRELNSEILGSEQSEGCTGGEIFGSYHDAYDCGEGAELITCFCVWKVIKFKPRVCGDSVFDKIYQNASEFHGGDIGDYLDGITGEQEEDLSEMLSKTYIEWERKHGLERDIFGCYGIARDTIHV